MNAELNGLEPPICLTKNIIGCQTEGFDLILLGDMFYDEAISSSLHRWLDLCIKTHGTKVLVGDPGRAQFKEHGIQQFLQQLAQYELPVSVKEENYGLTCSTVWSYCPECWGTFVLSCVSSASGNVCGNETVLFISSRDIIPQRESCICFFFLLSWFSPHKCWNIIILCSYMFILTINYGLVLTFQSHWRIAACTFFTS